MKILAFTDTHANKKNISNLKKSYLKHNPDILICAGDFTKMGRNISKNIKSLHFGKKLLFVPGNHEEGRNLNLKYKNIISIHNSSIKLKDTLFLGCGGGFSGDIEENLQESQKHLEKLIKNFRKSNKNGKIVMVTHRPPYKTTCDYMEEIDEHVGAKNIQKFLIKNKIDLNLCGHIHECFGNSDQIGKMLIINPGPNGAIIEI